MSQNESNETADLRAETLEKEVERLKLEVDRYRLILENSNNVPYSILRENEEKFRLIAENSGEGVWQLDLGGNLIYALIPKNKIFGYSNEEIRSLRFYEFFHASESERVRQAFNKAVAGESFQLLELTGIKKDGSYLPLEVNITPLIRDNAVVGVQGIVRDITERKKIQNEIERQKAIESELSKTGNLSADRHTDSGHILRSVENGQEIDKKPLRLCGCH